MMIVKQIILLAFGYATATENNAKIILKGSCTKLEKIVEDAKSFNKNANIVIEKQSNKFFLVHIDFKSFQNCKKS